MAGIDSYTKLCLHMDGTNGSTTFTDSSLSPKTVTANGNAQISTAESVFGGASGLFDGTGDYLSTPDSSDWDFGTGDFTIDFWVKILDYARPSSSDYLFSFGTTFRVRLRDSGIITLSYPSSTDVNDALSITDSNWHHLAFIKNGSTLKVVKDGTFSVTNHTPSGAIDSNGALYIGSGGTGANIEMYGYIDEFRVSNGIARWTSNFTPPTEAYSQDSTTKSLMLLGVG